MADLKMSERPLPNVAVEHRLTHMSFGHLGRVAYSPVDNDDQQVGRLQISRSLDSNQHFKLLSPFTEVCPPTRSAVPEAWTDKKPSDAARAQRNWLLQNHPEAAAGEVDGQALVDELSSIKTATADTDTASLLAVGEISDRTDYSGTLGRPAIAMPAGEGGHILHIVPLDMEDATWADRDLSLRLPRISSSARGQWTEDGVPITTIKFAVDPRRYDPMRWLLVQKTTGTTLFEPELLFSTLQGNMSEYEQSHSYSQMSRYISPNPLFTIKAEKTEGGAHVDVCFNPVVDGRFPQLGIIDNAGQWTVWDITGSRSVRLKVLQPIMTARGNIGIDPRPSLQPKLAKDSVIHKLLYVLPGSERRIKRDDAQGDYGHHNGVLYTRSPVRSSQLLVCNNTDVRLYDAVQATQLAGIRVVNTNRAESILDIQSSPISPSDAFVLTTSSLFWIDTKLSTDGQARIGVIFSFPHHKRADDATLTLSLSPLALAGRPKSCIAFITSGQDKTTDMLIFTTPSSEEVAHSMHQAISAELPPSIRSVYISPLPGRRCDRGTGAGRSDGRVSGPENMRVFQIFGLNSDLSLGSAQFAISDMQLPNTGVLKSLREYKESDKHRRRFLRFMEDAVVVPDSHKIHPAILPSLRPGGKAPLPKQEQQEPVKQELPVINLEAAFARLEELTLKEIAPARMSRQLLAGVIHSRVLDMVGDGDYMRLRTLSELLGDKLNGCNLDTLEEEWTNFCEEVDTAYEGKVQVVELGRGGRLPADLQSVTWQLSTLSFVNEDTPDSYKTKQRHLLRYLSGKQYLSLFGISVAPPPAIPSTEAEDALSQSQRATQKINDESLLPSSPPLRMQTRPSQDVMDIDESSGPATDLPDPGPLARLRRYIDIPATDSNLAKPSQTRLLSHWPATPTDPWSFVYQEDEGPLTAEDAEAMEKRKKRDEARRRKSRRQRLSMGLPVADGGEEDAGAGAAASGPSSFTQQQQQPYSMTPRGALSSQPRGREEEGFGSQTPSQRLLGQSQSQRPRISMSQVMPGPFGGRPGTAKKKARKSIFR